jgi:hypothetical protein
MIAVWLRGCSVASRRKKEHEIEFVRGTVDANLLTVGCGCGVTWEIPFPFLGRRIGHPIPKISNQSDFELFCIILILLCIFNLE